KIRCSSTQDRVCRTNASMMSASFLTTETATSFMREGAVVPATPARASLRLPRSNHASRGRVPDFRDRFVARGRRIDTSIGGDDLFAMSASIHAAFDTVESAIADIGAGRPVIVTDDENRENEGDLIMAASKVTPETVNMMIRYGSGIVCVPMLEPQLRRLGLGPMVQRNREVQRTDFTVSVDAAEGISTGISAYDRAQTIRILADTSATPEQLVQPGHVFPLRAKPGGVLERAGHTEAAVDLAILAGLHPSGVICELVNDDGSVK